LGAGVALVDRGVAWGVGSLVEAGSGVAWAGPEVAGSPPLHAGMASNTAVKTADLIKYTSPTG
jgi:hypothetical protein